MKKATQLQVVRLAHLKEPFTVEVTGKTHAAIIQEIKDNNLVLGTKSLSALLNGTQVTIGDWEAISEEVAVENDKKDEAKADKAEDKSKSAAADAKAAAAKAGVTVEDKKEPVIEDKKEPVIEDKKEPVIEDSKGNVDPNMKVDDKVEQPVNTDGKKTLTPEQAKLAADTEKELPTKEEQPNVEKPKRQLKDVSHLLPKPGEYREIKQDSQMHKLFKMMTREEGVTKKEACETFLWTDGGWGGIIHWEVKHKGYTLVKKMINGVAHYFLHWHQADEKHGGNGHLVQVKEDEIHVKAAKAVASPEEVAKAKAEKDAKKAEEKAAKEAARQAEKDAKAMAKASGVAPSGGAPAGAPLVGGGISRRVSAKKQAEIDAKNAAAAQGQKDEQPQA